MKGVYQISATELNGGEKKPKRSRKKAVVKDSSIQTTDVRPLLPSSSSPDTLRPGRIYQQLQNNPQPVTTPSPKISTSAPVSSPSTNQPSSPKFKPRTTQTLPSDCIRTTVITITSKRNYYRMRMCSVRNSWRSKLVPKRC